MTEKKIMIDIPNPIGKNIVTYSCKELMWVLHSMPEISKVKIKKIFLTN
jgi:hypothetical protein